MHAYIFKDNLEKLSQQRLKTLKILF